MAISICQDNKVEMPCNCLPTPPDTPNPINIAWYNGVMTRKASVIVADSASIPTFGSRSYLLPVNGSGQVTYAGLGSALVNFGGYKTVPTITINPPPGFPGPGLTQATATLTLDANNKPTIFTLTNPGAGYIPTRYIGYTVNQEPLGSTWVVVEDDDVLVASGSPKFQPVAKINLYTPPTGWAPEINSQLKCVFKFTTAVRRDTVGVIGGKFLINGSPEPNTMRIYNSMESKLIKLVHYSRELTLSPTDILTYEISTNDGAHLDLVSYSVGVYHPKTL